MNDYAEDCRNIPIYGRLQFLEEKPHIVIPTIILVAAASIAGTFGNILVIFAVSRYKVLRDVESMFIVNLAISDIFVTAIADPMNIVAKLEGEEFFKKVPRLCQAIGSICTISCMGSLLSIGSLSLSRYIYICHKQHYSKCFTKRNILALCFLFYLFGTLLVLLNLGDIGGHKFDSKAILCIWDRMANHSFTIFFSVVLVWVPMIITGVFYLLIYRFVSQNKIASSGNNQRNAQNHVAKTFFIIYIVFSVCWIPYALAIAIDHDNSFSHEVHSFIATFAHLHPSFNWIIYYATHKNFKKAFNDILCSCRNGQKQNNTNIKPEITSSQVETSTTAETDPGNARSGTQVKTVMLTLEDNKPYP